MPATQLKITDHTKVVQLSAILPAASVTGATNPNPVSFLPPACRQLKIQSDYANGAANVYIGDANLAPAAGTPIYGRILKPGDFDDQNTSPVQGCCFGAVFIGCSVDNTLVNIEWYY